MNTENKEDTLKVVKEKRQISYRGAIFTPTAVFWAAKLEISDILFSKWAEK